MRDNASKFSLLVRFIIFSDVLQHLVASDNFFSFIIIDRHSDLDPSEVIFHSGLVVFNTLNNLSSELLSVFLFIHEEGTSNQVFRIEDGRRWYICISLTCGCSRRLGLIHSGSVLDGSSRDRNLPSRHASTHIAVIRCCRTQQRTTNDDVRFRR
jgi:hypothetical protein